ncbi:acyl-CoA dehydrogenase family protein [Cryptosporangium arvum]|uniref:acyl-CoA dehydrogenase family protein n=1 Tax=Cryptosporangium arvum TaxID=80871 RepID=UPI0004AFAD2D|nr:acyl-CoA dehydrogenase family protein [Cryptosporangium arvum]
MSISVEEFRADAKAWLADSMPRLADRDPALDDPENDTASWNRTRELQKMLWDGGFAGIAFPRGYGGLGLTPEHQRAFNAESAPYELPLRINVPTLSICAATILDLGSEQQKRDRIGGALRGDELMVQFLSEPRGGSDLAGVTTKAERDGDLWVLNGAKIWSSGAYAADYGLCLVRTDWSVPKHAGLTMFLVPVHADGVTIRRIRQVNGSTEFCEEFFDDVRLPADAVVGEVNGGWAVASRQLYWERTSMGGGSPYVSGVGRGVAPAASRPPADLARAVGRLDDVTVRELIGESRANHLVQSALIARVGAGLGGGHLPGPSASMTRLLHAETDWRDSDIRLRIAGSAAVTGSTAEVGELSLNRQAGSLGGGSTEMARNVISERVLGMPREHAADRDVPFRDVRQGRW